MRVETLRNGRGSRLDEAREASLSFVVAELVEVLAELRETMDEIVTQSLRPDWLTAVRAAERYGFKNARAFGEAAAKAGVPKHYFSDRHPLYNRREVDEWLLSR